MTIHQFRIAAGTLIGFNILGTILTWAAGLQNPKLGAANAIAAGTQFTGPLVLVAAAIAAFSLTFSARRRLVQIGIILLALWGAGFTFGEVSQLFQHNVGISNGRWDVVLAGSVIGAVVGITTVVTAVGVLTKRRVVTLS